MNIILIAPPAAGKGTESEKLIKDYSLVHISTGDLLRKAINENTPLAKEINDCIAKGELVSDEIILKLIEKRILEDDCKDGYILDGFPRTINQAKKYDEMLEENGIDVGYVFVIDIDKELAKSRIVGRRSCPNCGRVYNVSFEDSMPKVENTCDDCGVELIRRKDDNEESFEKRYEVYLNETAPLIDYYENKNILYHIDGNIDKDARHKQVKDILDK